MLQSSCTVLKWWNQDADSVNNWFFQCHSNWQYAASLTPHHSTSKLFFFSNVKSFRSTHQLPCNRKKRKRTVIRNVVGLAHLVMKWWSIWIRKSKTTVDKNLSEVSLLGGHEEDLLTRGDSCVSSVQRDTQLNAIRTTFHTTLLSGTFISHCTESVKLTVK